MAKYTTCDKRTEQFIRSDVENLIEIIKTYRWIIDAYVSDFYTLNYWERLPNCVHHYFDTTEPSDLAWMLAADTKEIHIPLTKVVPLSLLALHNCIQNVSLKRTAADIDSSTIRSQIISSLEKNYHSKHTQSGTNEATLDLRQLQKSCESAVLTSASKFPDYKNGQLMDIKHVLRRHVKPKKQHEIHKLGQVISMLSTMCQCSSVVDVGAGLGHLSRLLTFQHGLQVTAIEAAGDHAPKATDFDKEVKRDLDKANLKKSSDKTDKPDSNVYLNLMSREPLGKASAKCEKNSSVCDRLYTTEDPSVMSLIQENELFQTADEESLPSHVISRVQPDIAAAQFLDIIKRRPSGFLDLTKGHCCTVETSEAEVSLHACGDLTPTLLRVFTDCPEAVGLASVACCYMKICQISKNETDLDNYPMSEFVKGLPTHQLSYEAREMACHFADAYYCRLQEKDSSSQLKVHSYRAALQYLVTSVNPKFRSGQVRLANRKRVPRSFAQYASEHLGKADVDFESVPKDLLEYCENLTKNWKRVVAFYTLRLSLAPAVESLILLDRALFLLENDISSVLLPIFQSSISPRNFALIAVKN